MSDHDLLQNGHHRHWPYIYEKHRKRQQALGINTKQMSMSQVVSLFGSVVAGVLLEANKVELGLVAGAFLILPSVLDLDGSVGAALSAKINHHLEKPGSKAFAVFLKSVGFALFTSLLAGLVVAGVGAGVGMVFFEASFSKLFWVAEGAIVLSALVGFPLIGGLSLLFRRFKVNPDDVVGPIESSVFDILTILTMVIVVRWLA